MQRARFWHCRGPFFHHWGYNGAWFAPMRGCLREGCSRVEWDYSYKRMKARLDADIARREREVSDDRA